MDASSSSSLGSSIFTCSSAASSSRGQSGREHSAGAARGRRGLKLPSTAHTQGCTQQVHLQGASSVPLPWRHAKRGQDPTPAAWQAGQALPASPVLVFFALTVQLCQVVSSEGALREQAAHPADMVDRLRRPGRMHDVSDGMHVKATAAACLWAQHNNVCVAFQQASALCRLAQLLVSLAAVMMQARRRRQDKRCWAPAHHSEQALDLQAAEKGQQQFSVNGQAAVPSQGQIPAVAPRFACCKQTACLSSKACQSRCWCSLHQTESFCPN